jgi:hypothetical protein
MPFVGRISNALPRLYSLVARLVLAWSAASLPGTAWAEIANRAYVVVVDVTVTDELPVTRWDRPAPPPYTDGSVFIRNGTLWISTTISNLFGPAIGTLPRGVTVKQGVDRLSEIGGVVIERIRYVGHDRRAITLNVSLGRDLPAPPVHHAPPIFEGRYTDSTYAIIPWPESITWQVGDGGQLKVSLAPDHLLEPGESLDLGHYAAITRVTVLINKLTGKDRLGRWKRTLIPMELGSVPFGSDIHVTFHGLLPVDTIDIR